MAIKVIYGPNGCGKTRQVEQMMRQYTYAHSHRYVRYLSFRDTYGASDRGYYLQQRFNSSEYDEVPTVREALGTSEQSDSWRLVFDLFDIEAMMEEQLILLSSGELRKFQLAKALLAEPRILVIDNPFIGLDVAARKQLDELFLKLSTLPDLDIVLVVSRQGDIPSYATEVVELMPMPDATAYAAAALSVMQETMPVLPGHDSQNKDADEPDGPVVELNHVSIRYGRRTILSDLDWTVKDGERWALEGPNGSGKSTLLSIICADIPQAYACDVTLFGRRRGTGESIWDIKSHIGYVSPELHRAYNHDVPVLDVVASGLHDKKGLYMRTTPEQEPLCAYWLGVFGIGDKINRRYLQLSSGEQRLALLARAFVKDPDLLILDEPLHGLDDANCARVKAVIEAFCARPHKTLIMVSHYAEDFPSCIDHHLTLQRH